MLRQNASVGLNMKFTGKAVPFLAVCSTSSPEWVMVLVRSGFGALAPCERQNNDLASRERDWKGEVEQGERKENASPFFGGTVNSRLVQVELGGWSFWRGQS